MAAPERTIDELTSITSKPWRTAHAATALDLPTPGGPYKSMVVSALRSSSPDSSSSIHHEFWFRRVSVSFMLCIFSFHSLSHRSNATTPHRWAASVPGTPPDRQRNSLTLSGR